MWGTILGQGKARRATDNFATANDASILRNDDTCPPKANILSAEQHDTSLEVSPSPLIVRICRTLPGRNGFHDSPTITSGESAK